MNFFLTIALLVFAIPTLCVMALSFRIQKLIEAEFALVKAV